MYDHLLVQYATQLPYNNEQALKFRRIKSRAIDIEHCELVSSHFSKVWSDTYFTIRIQSSSRALSVRTLTHLIDTLTMKFGGHLNRLISSLLSKVLQVSWNTSVQKKVTTSGEALSEKFLGK